MKKFIINYLIIYLTVAGITAAISIFLFISLFFFEKMDFTEAMIGSLVHVVAIIALFPFSYIISIVSTLLAFIFIILYVVPSSNHKLPN